jgi:hypothetical protein
LASNARRRARPTLETGTRSSTGIFAVAPQVRQSNSSQTSIALPFALTRNRFVHRNRVGRRQRGQRFTN